MVTISLAQPSASIQETAEQAENAHYERREPGHCAGCGASGVGLMNGHQKGWDKPFYCMECNPRFKRSLGAPLGYWGG